MAGLHPICCHPPQVACKQHGMVRVQCELLTALVLKVKDKLGILAILACKYVLWLENKCVELYTPIQHKGFRV